jgi:hypothetical protein
MRLCSIWGKSEQNIRIRRSARARERVWEKKECTGVPNLIGIDGEGRRRLQVSVEKFVSLRRFSRERRKGGGGGGSRLFIAGLACRGG